MKTDIPFNAVIKTLLFGKVPDLVTQRPTLCLLYMVWFLQDIHHTFLISNFHKISAKKTLNSLWHKNRPGKHNGQLTHWDSHTSYSTSYFANKSLKKYYRGLVRKNSTPTPTNPNYPPSLFVAGGWNTLWAIEPSGLPHLSLRDFHFSDLASWSLIPTTITILYFRTKYLATL